MKSVFIDGITKDSDFDDEMFLEILELDDVIERTKYIEDVRRKCKSVNRLREFDNLLKAWTQKNAQLLKQADSNETCFTDAPLVLKCGKYKADDTGVSIAEITKQGDIIKYSACPHPILPVERFVNLDTDTEKVKLAFFKDARWREIVTDCGIVFNKASISQLADRGVIVTSESAKDLVKYIAEVISLNMDKIPLYRSISRVGWVNGEFAPYVSDVKYDGDADFKDLYKHIEEYGDFKAWKEHVSELRKSLPIRLMLDVSFGSVLIELVGGLPFVLHLWGTTGFGKTVSLMVAASVWGNPEMGSLVRSMNMTANAMVRTAAFLHNLPFCADEMQQIKDRWGTYDNLIMYICEGIDRGKAKANGGIEDVKTWRNAFIFTGEEPITKESSGGGVKNRCIEVNAKEKIIQEGNKTANTVKENYGFAGKAFIEYLQTIGVEKIRADYREIFTQILQETDTTDKQAMNMAIILLADKYACEAVFADSSPLNVYDVKEYLASAKSVDTADRAYTWMFNWISKNVSRFDDSIDNNGEIWGRIEKDSVLINKNVLMENMSKAGFEFDAVKNTWAERGQLVKNSQGRFVHGTRVGRIKGTFVKIALPEEEAEIEHISDKDNPFIS